ncbi:MAG TPA: hypothetical protein ENN51_02460, partial [candidate division WOR-3 bacterium]|nr:hypothetical protein [candidate division WOR-3 bacterium]
MLPKALTAILCTIALAAGQGAWIGNLPEAAGSSSSPKVLRPQTVETVIPNVRTPASVEATVELLSTASGERRGGEPVSEPPTMPTDTLHWDGPNNSNGIGLTAAGTFYGAVRFTPSTGCTLTHVLWYNYNAYQLSRAVVYIWGPSGNPNSPGALLDTVVSTMGSNTWHNIAVPNRRLPAGQDFWVGVRVTQDSATHPIGIDAGPQVQQRGGYISMDGSSWAELYQYGLNYNWNIRAVVQTEDLPALDLAVTSVTAQSPIQPYHWIPVKAFVQNLGADTVASGVPVKLHITGPGGYNYYDTDQTTTKPLAFGQVDTITFVPNWYTQSTAGIYTAAAWCELTGDENPANDTARVDIDVTLWVNYANFNAQQYTTWAGRERGTIFYPSDFNLPYPATVESLKTNFNWHASYPWDDSTYQFIIYGNDLTTPLYTSPLLEATPGINVHACTAEVEIASGAFLVSIRTFSSTGRPTNWGDGDHKSRSVYGHPDTTWYYWTSGELHNAAYVNFAGVADDIGFYNLTSPYMQVEPGSAVTPVGFVRNYGINNQTAIACTAFVVDTVTDAIVYTGPATVTVAAGDSAVVNFPTWNVPDGNHIYQVYMFTYLEGDENPANDGITHLFFGFGINEPLYATLLSEPVTFDGVLNPAEWADAQRYDVSNIFGWSDIYRYFPGNVFLHLKYDDDYVYVGVDLGYVTTNEDLQLGLYFDENHDGAWEPDFSEGNYWYRSADNSLQFRGLTAGAAAEPVTVTGPRAAGIGSGRMQAEIALPIGTEDHELNIGTEDTLGFYLYALLEDYAEWLGWWHTEMPDDQWRIPASYGRLVLTPSLVVLDPPVPQSPADGGRVATLTPSLRVRNYQDADEYEFRVFHEGGEVTSGTSTSRDWVVDVPLTLDETYQWDARVRVGSDWSPYFDPRWSFTVVEQIWDPGWVEVAPIPAQAGNRRDMPHRGAWLAIGPEQGGIPAIYATKGNKLQNFYRYDAIADSWTELAPVPMDPTQNRPLRQGARGISDGDNSIYMVHGNNTNAFWHYDVAANEWTALADVPAPNRKRVKGGGDMLYIEQGGTGYVYLLKGDRNEFYRYNTESGNWEALTEPPPGIRARWKRDSWLETDARRGQGHGQQPLIYAHKANYYDRGTMTHDFYRYDVANDSWYTQKLAGMPLSGLHGGRIKNKKAKDGGAAAFDDGVIYALKGGNTQQFWSYYVDGDSWVELDTMPTYTPTTGKRRRVKQGGDIVKYGPGVFFALKGNKTVEFWRYVVPMGTVARRPERSGVMAGTVPAGAPFVKLGPNPLIGGFATLRYSLPKAGPAAVSVYDVSGRSVFLTRAPGHL